MSEQLDEVATNEDIPKIFHPVVEKHGRELFALVMNAGLGQQAAEVLVALAGKHSSRGGLHAAGILSNSFNLIANAYVREMGWTPEQLSECDRDCQLAASQQIIVPSTGIMNS